ncbi:pseudouridine synthase [Campylobacter troglodytis]|uniref:pseudouridine synthase n=1 Tax=Campylobacter troglodytis TaxID=654363 RepID=UPI001157FDBF|nr:pseudouridine synthase [Campylobacter troglodytis]TQR59033.1 rRNA pseudouridine synthase [Campylobacter troglodytis]
MRINQFISHNSDFSRRQADELIKQGLVELKTKEKNSKNSPKIAKLSDTVSKDDLVFIRGKRLFIKTKFSLIIYHKPKGELVSHKDERGRRTIYESLPCEFKTWQSVGRLDYASTGLLILSDSAKIVSSLMKSDLERKYYLKIKGKINEKVLEAMQNGLEIQGLKGAHPKSKLKTMKIAPFLNYEIFGESGGYTKLRVLIKEGQNRELRRFFGFFDLRVMDLKRVGFGVIDLGNLKEGKFRYFSQTEYDKLRDFLRYTRSRS